MQDDVVFPPGSLANISVHAQHHFSLQEAEVAARRSLDPVVDGPPDVYNLPKFFHPDDPGVPAMLVFHMNQYMPASARQLEAWSAFAISQTTLDMCGTFDENFFPSFFEDDDYGWRIRVYGFRALRVPVLVYHNRRQNYTHGSAKYMDRHTELRKVAAEYNEQHLRADFGKFYFRQKWGGYPPDRVHPFDNPEVAPRQWVFDPRMRACILGDDSKRFADRCLFSEVLLTALSSQR